MKVKFLSDYECSENLLRRFKANYNVYDNDIEFTFADDYDLVVAFNRADEHLKPGTKLITVIQEPSFSEAFVSKKSLVDSDYLIVHDRALFELVWNVKLGGKVLESPAFMFYGDKIDHHFYDRVDSVKKQKKISMIVSAHQFPWGNYFKRLYVLSQILKSDLDIDIYGRGLSIKDERYKGELEFKHEGLIPYEYSIAIENSDEKNYISEKFVDCSLCNTVPIYSGAPNVSEVYDERCFRKLNLDSVSLIEDIRQIISQPAPGTSVNKKLYDTKYNLYTKLKEIISDIQIS